MGKKNNFYKKTDLEKLTKSLNQQESLGKIEVLFRYQCSLKHFTSAKCLENRWNQMSAQTRITFDRLLQTITSFPWCILPRSMWLEEKKNRWAYGSVFDGNNELGIGRTGATVTKDLYDTPTDSQMKICPVLDWTERTDLSGRLIEYHLHYVFTVLLRILY